MGAVNINVIFEQTYILIKYYIHNSYLQGVSYMNKYIRLIEKSNNRNEIIEFKSGGYVHHKDKCIKGIMLKNKFYSVSEYEKLLEKGNNITDRRIEELQRIIENKFFYK